jgi:DNA (cytosine-5)-methyltransferase 1
VTRRRAPSNHPSRRPALASGPSRIEAATLRVVPSPGPVIGSLCTGAGGLDLGVLTAFGGGRIAWCADPDPHITQVLAARMPDVPNLGDLTRIDWTKAEPVDVLTAGFPCQDISAAGRRAGIEKGTRSGLWTHVMAAVRVLRPAFVVVENVAALRWRNGGLHRVLGDLADTGYDAAWRSVRAADIGAPHRRERVFVLAWPQNPGATNPNRGQPQRRRGPRSVAGPAGTTSGTRDQRQRHGHSTVDRGTATTDTGGLGCQRLHPPHPHRRTHAARPDPVAAHPKSFGQRHCGSSSRRRVPSAPVAGGTPAGLTGRAASDPLSLRWGQGPPTSAGIEGRSDPAVHRNPSTPDSGVGGVDWAVYEPAIRRWEHLLDRITPHPTQPGQHGRPVLAPRFVEHLMGLPIGWITDLSLPRTAQLRALGNGVVPQQAAYALALLLADLHQLIPEPSSPHERRAA